MAILLTIGLIGLQGSDLTRFLGDDSIELRELAHHAFIQAGPRALPALKRALSSPDAEIRARAGAAIGHIERVLFERIHDANEKARRLAYYRAGYAAERKPGVAFTEGARFEVIAIPRDAGMVLITEISDHLRPFDLVREEDGRIFLDIAEVRTADGKVLDLERCDRCRSASVLIKKSRGPVKVRLRGTQICVIRYPVEFLNPRAGDRKQVGTFSIEVDWPGFRVTSARPRPRHVFDLVGRLYSYELQGDCQRLWQSGSSGFGCGTVPVVSEGQSEAPWCECRGRYRMPAPDPRGVSERHIGFTETEHSLDQVGKLTYFFNKPIEMPFDITLEVSPGEPDSPSD